MSTPFTPSNGGSMILTPGRGGDSFSTGSDQSRLLPRQVSTGNYRGTQTITGELIVADPGTNHPVITISGVNQNEVWADPKTQIQYMVAGNFGNNQYGVKIAFPGIDVFKATDSQLIFNSNQNVFKIVDTGVLTTTGYTVTNPGTGIYRTFGGVPAFATIDSAGPQGIIGYVEVLPGIIYQTPYSVTFAGNGDTFTIRTIEIIKLFDRLEVFDTMLATGTTAAQAVTGLPVRYYILQESAGTTT